MEILTMIVITIIAFMAGFRTGVRINIDRHIDVKGIVYKRLDELTDAETRILRMGKSNCHTPIKRDGEPMPPPKGD